MPSVHQFCFSLLSFFSTWILSTTSDIAHDVQDVQGLKKHYYVPAPPSTHPSCAKGFATFCENVDKYPSQLIQSLLNSPSGVEMSDIFTDEREGLDEPPEHILHQESLYYPSSKLKRKTRSPVVSVKKKGTTFAKVDKNCRPITKTVEPKSAMNNQGEWRYILEGLRFEVEVCNKKCHIPCIQEFTTVPMKSLARSGKHLVDDKFFLPTHCKC